MKYTTLLFLFITNFSFSQLVSVSEGHKKSNAKDTSALIYAEAGFFKINRTLSSNPDFLNKPLGERVNETSMNLWSYSVGMVTPISTYFVFELQLREAADDLGIQIGNIIRRPVDALVEYHRNYILKFD